jgi:hypothetical protein
MMTEGTQARTHVEDQGRLAGHLDEYAGGIAPVSALLVGRTWAGAPDAEVGDSHRMARLVAATGDPSG